MLKNLSRNNIFIKENYQETDEEKQNLAEILTEYVQVLIVFPDRLSFAEETVREALAIYSSLKIIPKKSIVTFVKILNELGNVLDELGKYSDAENFMKMDLELLIVIGIKIQFYL